MPVMSIVPDPPDNPVDDRPAPVRGSVRLPREGVVVGSLIRHITIDCRDHFALMQFWRDALEDYHDHSEDPNKAEDEQSGLVGPPGCPWLLFVPVPEDKSVKNRLHLDIAPVDRTRDEEVERLAALGARVVGDHRRPNGSGWVVMTDPEGNEFCVERSAGERGLPTS
jgi:predicted enzyme related to lactoylglutathione lyase